MATMEDTSKVVVIDNRMKESIIWKFQEERNYLDTVGYGQYGIYAIRLVDSKDGKYSKMGKMTDTPLPYYTLTNEQAETENVSYLGKKVVKNVPGKTTLKVSDKYWSDIIADFMDSVKYDSDKPVSHLQNWQAMWRMACANHCRFMALRSAPANMPKDLLDFVVKNWQQNSPRMLRTMYENAQTIKAELAKAAIVTTQQASKAAKAANPEEVTEKVAEKVTA